MLEKTKAFAQSCKDVILYILLPVGLVVGFILHLINQNKELSDEVAAKEGDEKLKEIQGEKKQIDSVANDAIDEYEKLKKNFNE